MTTYTAQELITHAKAYLAADNARMAQRPKGVTRSSWRSQHPVDLPRRFSARDTAMKTRPARDLVLGLNSNVADLWIYNCGDKPRCIERIDLRAPTADEKLGRYEKV